MSDVLFAPKYKTRYNSKVTQILWFLNKMMYSGYTLEKRAQLMRTLFAVESIVANGTRTPDQCG